MLPSFGCARCAPTPVLSSIRSRATCILRAPLMLMVLVVVTMARRLSAKIISPRTCMWVPDLGGRLSHGWIGLGSDGSGARARIRR